MKRFLALALALCAPSLALAQEVTLDTFVRAESDTMIRANMSIGAKIGTFEHEREPTTAETQAVIRPGGLASPLPDRQQGARGRRRLSFASGQLRARERDGKRRILELRTENASDVTSCFRSEEMSP